MTRKILAVVGVILVATAVVMTVVPHVMQKKSAEAAASTVSHLRELMPEPADAVPDDRVNTDMSVLELDGTDYIGIIEIPMYGCTLPVCGMWDGNGVTKYPCRFTGSVYDGTLVVGGSDNTGQFDFMKLITGGDVVYITDVTGGRYKFEVTDIGITDDASEDNLCSDEADLTLFARNTYGFDYTVVRCVYK